MSAQSSTKAKPTPETLKRQKWALALAAQGFEILELRPNSKRPVEGLAWGIAATSDPDKIRAMFKANPPMNFGVCPASGHVILDLDVKIGINGLDAFGALEIEHGLLPDTFKVRTRGGGLHIYLRVPEEVGNANKFPDGIDVRGSHGYVVGPGCEVDGGTYEVESGELDSIAECPDWVLTYLGKASGKDPKRITSLCELDLKHNIEEAEKFLASREPAIQGDNGDDATYETLCFLRDFGLSDQMVLEVVLESDWNHRCEPPWPADELEEKIENSWAYAQNRPGSKRVPISRLRKMADVVPLHPENYLDWRREKSVPAVAEVANDEVPTDESEPAENRWQSLLYRGDAISTIKPPVPIIPGYLVSKGVTAALSTRGHGKTVIVLDMALRIAAEMEWCGEPVMPGWHVVYLCGEDAENTAGHIQAWCRQHSKGVVPEKFTFVTDVPNLLANGNHDVAGLVETIRPYIPNGAHVLWVVDTWQRATTEGSQNEDADMKGAFRNLEELAKSFDGAVIGCFHPPKDNAKTISGAAFQENATTGIWSIEKEHPDCEDSERKLSVIRLKGAGEGNFKLLRFDTVGLGERDPHFSQELTGAVANHVGGTGESLESAAERLREQRRKDADAVEAVFEVVKRFLGDHKRVLGSNRGDGGNVIKLDQLANAVEKGHRVKLGKTKTERRSKLRGYLDILTSKSDGRLEYREAHGKIKASYILMEK